jgi:hypothetical protein
MARQVKTVLNGNAADLQDQAVCVKQSTLSMKMA